MSKIFVLLLVALVASSAVAQKYCDCTADQCCVRATGYSSGRCASLAGESEFCGFLEADGTHYRTYCPCKPGLQCKLMYAGTSPYGCVKE
uniref:Clone 1060 transcribed RNA sequence n=1 Tax=Plectreurys tristis TaxID=33319 RepID=A0A0C4W7V1_PLETR|nr:venom peptide U5-PLTX-Pt1a [Plectreurys tristis]